LKNFTYLLLAGLFSFILLDSNAQTQRFLDPSSTKPVRTSQSSRILRENRCGTMEALEAYFRANPEARAMAERNKNVFAPETPQGQNQRVQVVSTIPVVFHIVGNATRQAQVTDADILWQLNALNQDYAGANADSTNGVGFYPIRAKKDYCVIRYCLAQRNALDLPSNGIERVVSTLNSTQNCGNNNLVKHTSSGGADAWDPTRFLNIWVGEFGLCLLGVATFPGTGAANEQGLIVSYEGFSNNPAYVDPAFALGRTASHELGHYWGLYHIWGDETTCTNSDFRQLPGTCLLPASLAGGATDQAIGDTPNQLGLTSDCPSGVRTDACSAIAPGINYQNYMDYTEDACYSMFTMKQADRMQWVLDNCRASLKTSNGCTPPPAAAGNDSRISAIINPANGSTLGCTTTIPNVTIQNLGSNTLTSAKINLILDGAPYLLGGYPVTWTGSLTQGQSANVILPVVPIPGVGTHVLKIHTTLPNASTDAVPANDTTISTITRIAASSLPVVNGFETTFLPTGWSNLNPNNDGLTWFRFNPTGGAAGGSVWAAVADNYDFDVQNTVDDIVTPVINTSGLLANDSLLIQFDLAHKNYVPGPGDPPIQGDSLKVLVTTNCGLTWTTIWQRGDPNLSTAGSLQTIYNPPAQGDWRTQKPAIGSNLFGGGQVQIAFRNINGFGNVTWLDNINIDIKPRKDMQTTAIVRPNATECTPPFVPSITVRNAGGEIVTAFKTGYILNGGTPFIQVHNITLAIGASTTVTFPSLNPPAGNNTIKMFVADPITASVGPDGTPGNDTLTRTFAVPTTVTNVIQGFEGTTFIPANWSLINANANVTWIRTTPGKASDFSAFIDNYNNNTINQLDIMQSPPVNTVGADGVTITFDVAHKDYPGSLDRLRVLVSTNCGVSFTSVYSKAGPTLATAGDSDEDFTNPSQNEWRNETINLNNTFTGGNLIVQFENRNDFGNNIFIDNINIIPVFKRDIEVLSLSPTVQCTPAFTPVATIRNRGTEAITGYSIAYAIGGGAAVTTVVTGVNIAPGATANVTLTAGTLVTGANSIKVYSFAPVTASGTGDQYLLNDTITRTTSVAGSVTAPTNVVETFEGSTFAPTGWVIANPDGGLTWQKATTGKNSLSSAFVRNFIYYANGQRDALYTPVLNYTGVDSVMLSFDLSATTKDLPANAPLGLDTLEVLVTKDCGNTFTSVYKKWGDQLQTIGNTSYPQPTEFNPGTHPFLWRTETINLTSYASGGPLQVVFRNSTNNQNDIYIDNVNFRTVLLPPRLKTDGVIVTPNPSAGQFSLWFVQAPTDLKYVTVLTSAGQLVWNKVFNGATSNVIDINLGNVAAGVYLINLGYGDKSKDKQIKILVTH
jgi:hypothetical protein